MEVPTMDTITDQHRVQPNLLTGQSAHCSVSPLEDSRQSVQYSTLQLEAVRETDMTNIQTGSYQRSNDDEGIQSQNRQAPQEPSLRRPLPDPTALATDTPDDQSYRPGKPKRASPIAYRTINNCAHWIWL
jgi:hypothetical protein